MTVDSSKLILTMEVKDYYKKFGFNIIEAAGAVLKAILKCQRAFQQLQATGDLSELTDQSVEEP